MLLYYFDLLSLVGTVILCCLAIFSKSFIDSVLQRMGLCIIVLVYIARAAEVISAGFSFNDLSAWSHIGTFIFAFGTWLKFAFHTYLERWQITVYREHNGEH